MTRFELFSETAEMLGTDTDFVNNFCLNGESIALDTITPRELAAQILEYHGGKI